MRRKDEPSPEGTRDTEQKDRVGPRAWCGPLQRRCPWCDQPLSILKRLYGSDPMWTYCTHCGKTIEVYAVDRGVGFVFLWLFASLAAAVALTYAMADADGRNTILAIALIPVLGVAWIILRRGYQFKVMNDERLKEASDIHATRRRRL